MILIGARHSKGRRRRNISVAFKCPMDISWSVIVGFLKFPRQTFGPVFEYVLSDMSKFYQFCWHVWHFSTSLKLTCVDDLWTQKIYQRYTKWRQRVTSNRGCPAVIGLTNVVPEFKGHLRRSTLRIGGNCRLCPFSVCCVSNFGGNCW